jgi:hypothetical protein
LIIIKKEEGREMSTTEEMERRVRLSLQSERAKDPFLVHDDDDDDDYYYYYYSKRWRGTLGIIGFFNFARRPVF